MPYRVIVQTSERHTKRYGTIRKFRSHGGFKTKKAAQKFIMKQRTTCIGPQLYKKRRR